MKATRPAINWHCYPNTGLIWTASAFLQAAAEYLQAMEMIMDGNLCMFFLSLLLTAASIMHKEGTAQLTLVLVFPNVFILVDLDQAFTWFLYNFTKCFFLCINRVQTEIEKGK